MSLIKVASVEIESSPEKTDDHVDDKVVEKVEVPRPTTAASAYVRDIYPKPDRSAPADEPASNIYSKPADADEASSDDDTFHRLCLSDQEEMSDDDDNETEVESETHVSASWQISNSVKFMSLKFTYMMNFYT